jgi:heme exporter protein C
MKMGGPAIHASMLIPLLLTALGFTAFYLALLIVRTQREILARKVRALRLAQVQS